MAIARVLQTWRARCILSTAFCWALASYATNAFAAESDRQTLGFVMTAWHLAMPKTLDEKGECPGGFQSSNLDNWKAQYPTEPEREKMHKEAGFRQNRGMHGENVFLFPETGTDPLPFREVRSPMALGANLDGTETGAATETTCSHQKFFDTNGKIGIDNQLYRATGCLKPYRHNGMFDVRFSDEKKRYVAARFLLEISNIGDTQNDDKVIVSIYKGRDKLALDSAGNVIPFTSQRVDERGPRYMHRTQGKILDGVLYTEPMDILFSTAPHGFAGETYIQDMRLELKLSDPSGSGMIVGYHDLSRWWRSFAKETMALEHVTQVSAPGLYQAIRRLADGHKDKSTGQCMSISTAYEVQFVRAFIVHTEKKNSDVTVNDARQVHRLAAATTADK